MSKGFKRVIAVVLCLILFSGTVAIGGSGVADLLDVVSLKASAAYSVGDTIYFGTYPQTDVTSSMGSKLNGLSGTWISYNYYTGSGDADDGQMNPSNYMRYKDVVYNGDKYRAVTFDQYRPVFTGYTSSANNSEQDENGYTPNNIYWFKYEPIRWRVLDPSAGLIIAETIIDSQAFNNYELYVDAESKQYGNKSKDYYSNNYEHSSIRQWLNADFYNSAFSNTQKALIQTPSRENKAYSTSYSECNSNNTSDKITLLSYAEANSTKYFSSNEDRKALGSDYAKCQGLRIINGYSIWRLRSAGSAYYRACYVNFGGGVGETSAVCYTFEGIRPALNLNLNSDFAQHYTVTYNSNGGTGSTASSTHTYGVAKKLTANAFTKAGYSFTGWNTKANGSGTTYVDKQSVLNLSSIDCYTITLYAQWKANTYTVFYNANGGKNPPASQTKTHNVALILSSGQPTRNGYSFLGWAANADATVAQYQPGDTITINSDMILYAVWIDVTNPVGTISSSNNETSSQTVTLTMLDNDGIAGYYWGTNSVYSNNSYTSTSSTSVTKTVSSAGTYYLTVKDTSGNISDTKSITFYKTTLDANGGSVSSASVLTASGNSFSLPLPTRTEYSFSNWNTSSNGNGTAYNGTYTPTSNKTLYAQWSSEIIYVTDVSVLPTSVVLNVGDTKQITATVLPSNAANKGLTWSSSNTGVVTVSETGLVTAESVGSATITVKTSDGGYTATSQITVEKKKVAPTVITNEAGSITETGATLSGNISDIGSSAVSIRQIVYYEKVTPEQKYTKSCGTDFNATVTGLKPSTEYCFYAKADNGDAIGTGEIKSFTTKAKAIVEPTSISVNPTYAAMEKGSEKTLLVTVLPENAENRSVTWSSSNSSVAIVSNTGIVTAVSVGKAKITATTVNGLKSSCSVEVTEKIISGEFDFSEHNLITNMSNLDNKEGWDWGPNDGGNSTMATAYLARWDGAVLEINDKYPTSKSPSDIKYKEVPADYHSQEVLWLPDRTSSTDNDEIKYALMNYGAIYASFNINWYYFNNNKSTYYNPDTYGSGHAITIVGWDDNYSKSNFVETPQGNGAFICKNSWGTNSGNVGYFYISYYDKSIKEFAVFNNLESNTNYNKIYQYDSLGAVASFGYEGTTWEANVFPENGRTLSANEALSAVAFYTYSENTSYEVYVVTDYYGESSLTNGRQLVKSGTIKYAGYHTVTFDEINLTAGKRFAVIVKLSVPEGKSKVYIEMPIDEFTSNARANHGESYYDSNGNNWKDLCDLQENSNLCIKAFTNNYSSGNKLFAAIDNDNRQYESDKVHSVNELVVDGFIFNKDYIDYMPEVISNRSAKSSSSDEDKMLGYIPPTIEIGEKSVDYASGASFPAKYDLRDEGCVTSVKDQGSIGSCWAFASYASLESCTLKKAEKLSASSLSEITSNAMLLDAVTQNGNGQKPESITVSPIPNLTVGQIYRPEVSVLPVNANQSLLWYSSDESIATVDSSGTITVLGEGDCTITVISVEEQKIAKSITINTLQTPEVYFVKFISDGKTVSEKQYKEGEMIVKPSDPVKAGYAFKGWSPEVPATMSANDLTFTAVFEPSTYTLTYDANGGKGAPAPQTGGELITLSTVKPTREGYKFLGWGVSEDSKEAAFQPGELYYFVLKRDTTIYAVWEKDDSSANPTAKAQLYTGNSTTITVWLNVTIVAKADNVPKGYKLVVCDKNNKVLKEGDNKSVSYNAGAISSDTVFNIHVVDGKGNIMSSDAGELSKTIEVKTSGGFFAWFFGFLFNLFGIDPGGTVIEP